LRALQVYLDGLQTEHDELMSGAFAALQSGDDNYDVLWAYAAGLLHAIRTIQVALDEGEFR
jgi:hypothetical protein